MADVVTLTPTKVTGTKDPYTFTCTSSPTTAPEFTITALKNDGSTVPTYNTNGKDIRVYAKGTLKIVAPTDVTIDKIVFNISSQGLKRLAPITASSGTIAAQTKGDKTVTWTGSASSLDFTVGAKADYGSENTKAGQFCVSSISVTYTETNSDLKSAGLSYPETSVDVYLAEVDGASFPILSNPNNLAVTYSSEKESVATVDATGKVTIVGAGTTTITAISAATSEFKAGEASYTLNVIGTINSVAEAKAITGTDKYLVNFPLTVAFVNYSNIFAVDDAGDFIQVYGTNTYKVGDVIPAGWTAEYELYKGYTPELKPDGSLPEADGNNGFTPEAVDPSTITTAMVNSVLLIKNVEFAAATPAGQEDVKGTVNGSEITLRNQYKRASVEAGKYDVTVLVQVYNGNPSLYIINYAAADDPTGITDIVADDANAPVEYFNLQGIRVENPENGLYIRRQGNKVSKVIIK